MKLSSSSKNSQTILLVLLVMVLLFAVYYYVVLPKKNEVELLESSISSIQSEIDSLQNQITAVQGVQTKETSNVFAYRKKLPQSREIDKLLLNLEEIGYVTESKINGINFNSYDELVSESAILPTEEDPTTENGEAQGTADVEAAENLTTENSDTETTATEQAPVSAIAAESLPPELKLITFNIDVESMNYQYLQQFIKEIEDLDRVMHIDTINYSLPGEENEFAEEPSDVVSASIQVTTFYYEGES